MENSHSRSRKVVPHRVYGSDCVLVALSQKRFLFKNPPPLPDHLSGCYGAKNCIVSHWVDGLDLDKVLRAGCMEFEKAKRYLADVIEGLQYLHITMKIAHRDIKPGNIMIPDEFPGNAKIIDFGLAKSACEHIIYDKEKNCIIFDLIFIFVKGFKVGWHCPSRKLNHLKQENTRKNNFFFWG